MNKNETMQKLIAMLRKDAYEATTLVAHYADELKKLQDHNAAIAVSLQEFLYRVSGVAPFDSDKWLRDLGEDILKKLQEGPK